MSVRVVVLLGVGLAAGCLVAPVVVQSALGRLELPANLFDASAAPSATARSTVVTAEPPSLRAALGRAAEDLSELDRTFRRLAPVLDRLGDLTDLDAVWQAGSP